MNKAFTLIEMVVSVLIIAVLAAMALPYYFHAVENSRMTEAVMLWGRTKNHATGNRMITDSYANRFNREANEPGKLKYFTVRIFCREKENDEICWEAEFTQKDTSNATQYKLATLQNFRELACVGLNNSGEDFCFKLTDEKGEKVPIGTEDGYVIRY